MNHYKYKTIRNIFELFLAYCFAGWLYEVIWCNIIENNIGFRNNGFLFGPWLPIYGFGMLLISFVLNKINAKTPVKIFMFGAIIAAVAELIGSYFMELLMGKFLWDYSGDFLNFQGRIALRPEIYFGFLVLAGVYWLKPKIEVIQIKYDNNRIHNAIAVVLFALFFIDLIARFRFGSNLK